MQFAFSYFYYIVHAVTKASPAEFVGSSDTDGNGFLSKGELKIFMTRLYDLPLSENSRSHFWTVIKACFGKEETDSRAVSVPDIASCTNISSLIDKAIKNVTKYNHEIVDDREVTFKMLKSNATKVQIDLDYIRRAPKKFICLNDNMDHSLGTQHESAKLLSEFYETMFPKASPFEYQNGHINQFLYIEDYNRMKLNSTEEIFFNFILAIVALIVICILVIKRRTLHRHFRVIVLRIFC